MRGREKRSSGFNVSHYGPTISMADGTVFRVEATYKEVKSAIQEALAKSVFITIESPQGRYGINPSCIAYVLDAPASPTPEEGRP